MCVYFYVLNMGNIRATYSDATGLWWENRYRAVFEAVLNIVLNFVLGKIWGIYGIIFATLISLFIINFLWGSTILFKNYFTNIKISEFYVTHAFYAFVTILSSIITLLCVSFISNFFNIVLTLFISAIICTVIPNIIFLVLYSKNQVFKDINFINYLQRKRK